MVKTGIRKLWSWTARRKFNTRKLNLCEKDKRTSSSIVSTGTYSSYPCCMTMKDLSNNAVSILSGVYITKIRHFQMEEIRTKLHKLQDTFWNILTECGSRKQINTPGHIAQLAFCSWASSVFNSKLVAAFCETARDTLIITVSDNDIMFKAPKLDSYTANNLLDNLACVTLTNGLLDPKAVIADGQVEVTTTYIDSFCVSVTVSLCPFYMDDVKMDEARFMSMYSHIVAKFL